MTLVMEFNVRSQRSSDIVGISLSIEEKEEFFLGKVDEAISISFLNRAPILSSQLAV
jgi:hypothetical protein